MPTGDLQQLSIILKRERLRSGLSVRQLAAEVGMPTTSLARIEAGEVAAPNPRNLQRLAEALSIDVEELYAEVGYLAPSALPGLRPYLRAKFGLTDAAVQQVEGYVQAVRDINDQPPREGNDDSSGDANP